MMVVTRDNLSKGKKGKYRDLPQVELILAQEGVEAEVQVKNSRERPSLQEF